MSERTAAAGIRALALGWVLSVCAGTGGCVAVEAVAGAFGGDSADVEVAMRYAGLENQRVAVVAAIDPALARQRPDLGPAMETLLSDRFARHVAGARVLPPAEVAQWRLEHPYWESVPPGKVTAGLGVDRVVRVEVAEFRTRQNGNANVLEGVLDAAVQVYANVDAGGSGPVANPGLADPDRPVFADRVRVRFPEDSELGIPQLGDSGDPGPDGIATPGGPSEATVVKALLGSWIRRTGPLFYDQKEAKKRDKEAAKRRADAGGAPAGVPA